MTTIQGVKIPPALCLLALTACAPAFLPAVMLSWSLQLRKMLQFHQVMYAGLYLLCQQLFVQTCWGYYSVW